MTGTQCFQAALTLLGETPDSGAYYARFARGCLCQLLCNCRREIDALRQSSGAGPAPAVLDMPTLESEIPADEGLVRECFPYGLAALLVCEDDREKFNLLSAEFSTRLLAHCPAVLTAVQEML